MNHPVMAERRALFDLLQWLPHDAAEAFMAAARRRSVAQRGLIYEQSTHGDEMFRLMSGSVRLSILGHDGRELLYVLFAPGDCFGTSSVVDGEPRPHTAEAFETVELQVFSREAIDRLRRDHPVLNDALLKLLSRHMRLLSDYFAGATLDEVSYRLAQRLVEVADNFGVTTSEGVMIGTRISQSELASMVGTARQTVNRVLQSFQDRGLVAIRGGVITLINVPDLQAAAQGASLGLRSSRGRE